MILLRPRLGLWSELAVGWCLCVGVSSVRVVWLVCCGVVVVVCFAYWCAYGVRLISLRVNLSVGDFALIAVVCAVFCLIACLGERVWYFHGCCLGVFG